MRIVPRSSAFTSASCHKGIHVSSFSSCSYVCLIVCVHMRFEVYLEFANPPPPFRTFCVAYISLSPRLLCDPLLHDLGGSWVAIVNVSVVSILLQTWYHLTIYNNFILKKSSLKNNPTWSLNHIRPTLNTFRHPQLILN